MASPSADSDIATKKYVDDIASGDAGAVQQALTTHINKTTGVHGAVSTATANKIAIRDGSGRLKVNDPSDALDAANKQTVISWVNALAVQIWTAISDMKFGDSKVYSIAYGNGKFVAVGVNGKGAYSTDGVTWTAISMKFGSSAVYSIAYGNGKFVAGGVSGKGSYSTDGVTWTAISDMKFGSSEIYSRIYSIAYGNGKFVAVGVSGKGSYSTDGVTWTAISDMKFDGSTLSSIIYSIAYGNGKFVAGGASGKGAYSTDGVTWTAISDMKFGSSTVYSIAYGNGKFVAVGVNGKGAYSTALHGQLLVI